MKVYAAVMEIEYEKDIYLGYYALEIDAYDVLMREKEEYIDMMMFDELPDYIEFKIKEVEVQ